MFNAGFHAFQVTGLIFVFLSTSLLAKAESIQIATGEYPPWTSESLPDGGYINRVVKEAFALSNIKVEFHYLPWKRALEATKVGKYHASSFWGEDEKRREFFILSDLIDNIYFVFFYQKARFSEPFQWKTLRELSKYRIGATRGYTYTDEFWRLSEKNKLRVSVGNDDIEGLTKLMNGTVDLFPIDEYTGKYLLKKNFSVREAETVRVDTRPLSTGKNFILFSRNNPESKRFSEIFNQNLKKIKAAGKLHKFKEKLF